MSIRKNLYHTLLSGYCLFRDAVQTAAAMLPSCTIVLRVLKDICHRVPAWGVLDSWVSPCSCVMLLGTGSIQVTWVFSLSLSPPPPHHTHKHMLDDRASCSKVHHFCQPWLHQAWWCVPPSDWVCGIWTLPTRYAVGVDKNLTRILNVALLRETLSPIN